MLSISISQNDNPKFKKGISLGDLIRKGVTAEEIKKKLGLRR